MIKFKDKLKDRINQRDFDTINSWLRNTSGPFEGTSVIGSQSENLDAKVRTDLKNAGVIFDLETLEECASNALSISPSIIFKNAFFERIREGFIDLKNTWREKNGNPAQLGASMVRSLESGLKKLLNVLKPTLDENSRTVLSNEAARLQREKESQRINVQRDRNRRELGAWLENRWNDSGERLAELDDMIAKAFKDRLSIGAKSDISVIEFFDEKKAEFILEKFLSFDLVKGSKVAQDTYYDIRFVVKIADQLIDMLKATYKDGFNTQNPPLLNDFIQTRYRRLVDEDIDRGGLGDRIKNLSNAVKSVIEDWQKDAINNPAIIAHLRSVAISSIKRDSIRGDDVIKLDQIQIDTMLSLSDLYHKAKQLPKDKQLPGGFIDLLRQIGENTIREQHEYEARIAQPTYDSNELLVTAWASNNLLAENGANEVIFRMMDQHWEELSNNLAGFSIQQQHQVILAQGNRIAILEQQLNTLNALVTRLLQQPGTTPLALATSTNMMQNPAHVSQVGMFAQTNINPTNDAPNASNTGESHP